MPRLALQERVPGCIGIDPSARAQQAKYRRVVGLFVGRSACSVREGHAAPEAEGNGELAERKVLTVAPASRRRDRIRMACMEFGATGRAFDIASCTADGGLGKLTVFPGDAGAENELGWNIRPGCGGLC